MSESTLMTMLNTHMRYLSQRQVVLSRNIANVDTPDFKTEDVKSPDFDKMAKGSAASMGGGTLQMAATSPSHLQGTLSGPTAFAVMKNRESFETTPVGNNVSLEEQMANVSDTGAKFQISNSLLKKFTTMYRSALGNH